MSEESLKRKPLRRATRPLAKMAGKPALAETDAEPWCGVQ
jgi:hypothetical protein